MTAPDTLPAGGRDILGLLDLAPMSTPELAAGLSWPHGAVSGLVHRLRSMGVIRMADGRWRLTGMAELHAVAPKPGAPLGSPRPPRHTGGSSPGVPEFSGPSSRWCPHD